MYWKWNIPNRLGQCHVCSWPAPCIARTSAAMVLTMYDKWFLVINREGTQLPAPSSVKKMEMYFSVSQTKYENGSNPHGCQDMVMVHGYDCNIYWGPCHVTREACVGPFILANHETLLTQPTGHEMNRQPPVHRERFHGYHISGRIIYSTGNPVRYYVISVMPYLAVHVIGNCNAWPMLTHLPLVLHICGSESGQH